MPAPGERNRLTSNDPNYFAQVSEGYLQFRPTYPAELFEYLASLCPGKERVWDCGAGNGQASVLLAERFESVIATDLSWNQLLRAQPHPRVQYVRCRSEAPPIAGRSVDLVTAAQAAHWYDFDLFYQEVRRALRPDGVVALWCYGLFRVNEALDAILYRFYEDPLGSYWPKERRYVDAGYGTLPFPFDERQTPQFEMKIERDFGWLLGYLATWSAVQAFKNKHKRDPVAEIAEELRAAWGSPDSVHTVCWPIHMRLGT